MVRDGIARVSPGRLVRPLLVVLVLFYFSYHLVHGERGLFALVRDERRLELLHTNVRKYGTISNTVAKATKLEGTIRRAD